MKRREGVGRLSKGMRRWQRSDVTSEVAREARGAGLCGRIMCCCISGGGGGRCGLLSGVYQVKAGPGGDCGAAGGVFAGAGGARVAVSFAVADRPCT